MSMPPILQNPLNEERNPKRDREEATTSSRPIAQTYVKRQRLNPFSEQKFMEEIVGATISKRAESRQATPSGGTQEPSITQILERKQSVEVSSFKAPIGQDQNIIEKCK